MQKERKRTEKTNKSKAIEEKKEKIEKIPNHDTDPGEIDDTEEKYDPNCKFSKMSKRLKKDFVELKKLDSIMKFIGTEKDKSQLRILMQKYLEANSNNQIDRLKFVEESKNSKDERDLYFIKNLEKEYNFLQE